MSERASKRETTMVTARVPPDLHRRVREIAFGRDESLQQVVVAALTSYVKAYGGEKEAR